MAASAVDVSSALEFLKDVEFRTGDGDELRTIAAAQFTAMAPGADGAEGGMTDQDLLQWCHDHELLRVVSADITPLWFPGDAGAAGVVVYLHDVKVSPPRKGAYKGRKGITDDAVYADHEDIRERVPRGLAFMQVAAAGDLVPKLTADGKPNGTSLPPAAGSVTLLLRGLRKFTGKDDGDDDDTLPGAGEAKGQDSDWRKFFTADPASATHIAAMEKANGESGHFGVVVTPPALAEALEGAGVPSPPTLYVGGSKSVHVVFRDAADLASPVYGEPRYSFAKPITQHCLEVVQGMGEEQRGAFHTFMSTLHLTLCVEFLNPATQHVERFDFDTPVAQALTFVSGRASQPPCLALGLHPIVAVSTAAHFGFATIQHALHPIGELPAVQAATRYLYGKEGFVLYYMDAAGTVISLVKRKSVWYIIQRAVREKARGAGSKLAAVYGALHGVRAQVASPHSTVASIAEAARGMVAEWTSTHARLKRSAGAWNRHGLKAAQGEPGLPSAVASAVCGSGATVQGVSVHPLFASMPGKGPDAPVSATEAWLAACPVAPAAAPATASKRGRGRGRGGKKKSSKGGGGEDLGKAEMDLPALLEAAAADAEAAAVAETANCACRVALRLIDIQSWLDLHPDTVTAYANVGLGFIAALGEVGPAVKHVEGGAAAPQVHSHANAAAAAAGGDEGAPGDASPAARAASWLTRGWDPDLLSNRYPQLMAVWLEGRGLSDDIPPRTVGE